MFILGVTCGKRHNSCSILNKDKRREDDSLFHTGNLRHRELWRLAPERVHPPGIAAPHAGRVSGVQLLVAELLHPVMGRASAWSSAQS